MGVGELRMRCKSGAGDGGYETELAMVVEDTDNLSSVRTLTS